MRRELLEAAEQLGRDGVLADPGDAEIILASQELAFGHPASLHPATEDAVIEAWEKGDREREEAPWAGR